MTGGGAASGSIRSSGRGECHGGGPMGDMRATNASLWSMKQGEVRDRIGQVGRGEVAGKNSRYRDNDDRSGETPSGFSRWSRLWDTQRVDVRCASAPYLTVRQMVANNFPTN
jgi:hypothetical protein